MRKLILLGVIAALAACTQADQDQYKCPGNQPVYGETNSVCYDATNDYLSMWVNDVEVAYLDSSGNFVPDGTITSAGAFAASSTSTFTGDATFNGGAGAVTLGTSGTIVGENAETIDNATDTEWCFNGAGGTNNEDWCVDLETTANAMTMTSNTGVVNLDLAAVGTTVTLANDQTIVSDTDNEIQFGDNSEDVSLGFGTANTVTLSSDTAVDLVDFATLGTKGNVRAVTGADTLDQGDCGKLVTVSAGIDTNTITLPSTIAGCEYKIMYVGADGGALLDISPAAADAVHGSCTLAASVLEFNGTDDNDIGLTKATANTGDTITLMGDGTEGWYVTACAGIWANN